MNNSGGNRISIYPERDRAIFDKLCKKLSQSPVPYKGIIQQAKLRTEVYAENGRNDYQLDWKANAPKLGSNANRELRLKEQDAFVFTRIRFGLLVEKIAGPVGHERTYLYVPQTVFANEAGGFQNEHLEALYNGSLNVKVGDTVYLDEFPLAKCYSVKTQQETATIKTEVSGEDGWVNLTPQFAIKGFDNNDFRLRFPNINANHKIQYNATNKVVLVVEAEGYKVTGAGTGNFDLSFGK